MDEKKFTLNRILIIFAATLAAFIVAVTVIALLSGAGRLDLHRKADPTPEQVTRQTAGKPREVDAFTNLHTMRVGTKPSEDNSLCSISLNVWFSYKAGDTVFYEELCQKERTIKAVIYDYFSSYSKKDLLSIGEKQIKEDLKDLINRELVLGKIINVYFDEYLYLD